LITSEKGRTLKLFFYHLDICF